MAHLPFLLASSAARVILPLLALSLLLPGCGAPASNPPAGKPAALQAGARLQSVEFQGEQVVANQIIVRLSGPIEQVKTTLPAGTPRLIHKALHLYQVTLPAQAQLADALATWRAVPGALYAEPDRLQSDPDPGLEQPGRVAPLPLPRFSVQAFTPPWNLTATRVTEAWAVTKGDPTVIVAVIDTGVDPNQPSLKARLLPMKDYIGTDTYTATIDGLNYDFTGKDNDGHGTHVAGIVGGDTDETNNISGVAPLVTILPIKVFAVGSGAAVSTQTEAIDYAVAQGAMVINMSLGGATDSQARKDAIANATSKGVVVVASTGNAALERGRVLFPAAHPGAIAVAASNAAAQVSYYSSFGPEVLVAAPGGDAIEGRLIASTGPTYLTPDEIEAGATTPAQVRDYQGTSMAAPHVAGAIALLRTRYPNLTPAQVRVRVGSSVRSMISGTGFDENAGFGQIDVLNLLSPQDVP